MNIKDIVIARKIEEILHFTTNNGLVGIIRQRQCKARNLLKEDETLVHILKLNTQKEFDVEWKEYVNLSISRINTNLFEYSKRVNHAFNWRILSFSPEILSHDGVLFTTTNNAYPMHLKRGEGEKGLSALFANSVIGRYGKEQVRWNGMPDSWTTCVQAEVLYPKTVSLDFLQRIYVPTEKDADSVAGKFATFGVDPVEVVVQPEKFR